MDPQSKRALVVVAFWLVSVGCTFLEPQYTVTPSFTVHVSNRYGRVVGLTLRATRPKDSLPDLISDELRARLVNEKVIRVEEAVTDSNGDAHFDLDRPGHWYLEPYNAARGLDYVSVFADPHFEATQVNLQWPSGFLEAKHLRGRISEKLTHTGNVPLNQGALSLHDYISLAKLASTRTSDDGTYQFDGVAPGNYFLGINVDADSGRYGPHPHGYIPIHIGPDSPLDGISLAAQDTTCGLFYDLE
jgi:hypothetical protein